MLEVKGLGAACPPGYVNISQTPNPNCVRRCDPDRNSGTGREWWNPATQTCQFKCDDINTGNTWSGMQQRCVPICSYPYQWSKSIGRCVPISSVPPPTPSCPAGQTWNNAQGCVPACPAGTYDPNSRSCVACPFGTIPNGDGTCRAGSPPPQTACPAGQERDFNTKQCRPCSAYGMAWNSAIGKCQVPGSSCGGGKQWNAATNSCACPPGQEEDFNTKQCRSCSMYGLEWNPTIGKCQAPGSSCGGGKIWQAATNTCACPEGQEEDFRTKRCRSCSAYGLVWNARNKKCQIQSFSGATGNTGMWALAASAAVAALAGYVLFHKI